MNGPPDDLDTGVNQKRAGHFNERLVLSLVHREGTTAAGPLAQQTGLSFQTVSVILRRLERDGLILRADPLRGQIGKPVTPVRINPDGAFAFGLKIGRRSADLVLLDMSGACRATRRFTYERAELPRTLKFLKGGIRQITRALPPELQDRIVGLGIARPGKIGTWPEGFVLPSARPTTDWDDAQLLEGVGRFVDVPVILENDATAACQAEYAFGDGKALTDFGYFYLGTFLGGGVVINDAVFRGTRGHAGAFGALRITSGGREVQLVEGASLHLLETALRQAGHDPAQLLRRKRWSGFAAEADAWLARVAPELARAVVSVCAVIDFEVVYIDGNFPSDIRERLVKRVQEEFAAQDTHGILAVEIRAGRVGRDARAIGAAASALITQFFPRS
jgi:predicted NBD/HSP70 family sugar kinase